MLGARRMSLNSYQTGRTTDVTAMIADAMPPSTCQFTASSDDMCEITGHMLVNGRDDMCRVARRMWQSNSRDSRDSRRHATQHMPVNSKL